METFRKLFLRKTKTLCQIDTNVKVTKSDISEEWEVNLLAQDQDQPLISPTKKRLSLFSSRESLMSSRESLDSIGVAYRRHPDDKKSKFSRPNSVSTSSAVYGRYSMCNLDEVGNEDISMDEGNKELSLSLASLERIESLQKRSFDIARNRRKHLRNKENKKIRLAADDEIPRKIKAQSMIELNISDRKYDGVDFLTVEIREAPPVVVRNSSMQKKSWEIRRERKMKMKKRRSMGYNNQFNPLTENT